jgi:rhamnosyltransferase subunit B
MQATGGAPPTAFLVLALGSAGDVHPFLALGRELLARGHEVTVLTNERFAAVTRATGLGFVPIGDQKMFDRVAADPRVWRGRKGLGVIFGSLAEWLPQTVDAVRAHLVPGRTVMVASSLGMAARLVRDADHVPLATVHLAPAVMRSTVAPPRLPDLPRLDRLPRPLLRAMWWLADRFVIDPLLGPVLVAEARRLGVPTPRRPLNGWWSSPDLVVCLFPEWFGAPAVDWPRPLVLAGFPLFDEEEHHAADPQLDAWLGADEPPLVVTPGSAHKQARGFVEGALGACERLGRRALVITGAAENLPAALPGWALHRAYVPFGRVFPRAAAVMHHGGIGTTAQVLAAGVPQLVAPFAHDQPDNAARVERLGAGIALPAWKHDAETIEGALRRLLGDPSFAAVAKSLAPRLRRGEAVTAACDAIERLAPRGGEPVV